MTAPDTAAALARARQQLAASPYELAALVAHIDDLQCQIGNRRMCVNCGQTRPASEPKSPMIQCVGPDGLSACTWDATPQEAWEYWRKKAHDNWGEIKQQAAQIDALAGALQQAAGWFGEYGDGHQRKGDTDKARRNFDREAFCRAALAEIGGAE